MPQIFPLTRAERDRRLRILKAIRAAAGPMGSASWHHAQNEMDRMIDAFNRGEA